MAVAVSRGAESLERDQDLVRATLPPLICAGVALLLGCGAASSDEHSAAHIVVELAHPPQSVEVRGIGRTAARGLQRLAPNDSTWPRVVAVYVDRGATDSASTPAVI